MTDQILNLTLEFIYLLTGEDCTVVKKSGECLASRSPPHEPGGWDENQSPTMMPSSPSVTDPKDNEQKILAVINKIIQMLTGEVPIRCQDVTVYLSMEEWEYLEGHKDQYKDVMMEDQRPLTPHDNGAVTFHVSRPTYLSFMNETPRMEKDRNKMAERIINLTLEIIYLLTGEDYTIVKTSPDKPVAPGILPCVSGGWSRTQGTIMSPLSEPPIQERSNVQKILQLTNKMIELLSGEVPVRCQDVTVYLSMEEWEYLEEHKDQYKDVMMEDQRPLTPHDTEYSRSNPPESGHSPPYCQEDPEEMHRVLQDDQVEDLMDIKDEVIVEEQVFVKADGRYEIPKDVGTADFPYTTDLDGQRPLTYPKYEVELSDTSREHPCPSHVPSVLHNRALLTDSEEASSDQSQKSEIFQCSDCGKRFTKECNLIIHKRTHKDERPFSCLECGKYFTRRQGLVTHERIHTGEKPYSCTVCGKCFTQKSTLFEHQKSHTGEKPFSCSDCGRGFIRKSDFIIHQRIHTGEKPYLCLECGKRFTRKQHLDGHQKFHTGEKPFSCSECGKCFTQNSDLIRHRKVHTGERPFSCLECGKCFTWKTVLVEHQRIHTGEKPYLCPDCGKNFTLRSHLVKHRKIHTRGNVIT